MKGLAEKQQVHVFSYGCLQTGHGASCQARQLHYYETMTTPAGKLDHFRQILSCKKIWGPKANSNFTSVWTKVSHSTYKTSNLFRVSLLLQTIPHPCKYNYNILQNSLLFWHRLWIYKLQQQWSEQVKPAFKFYLWVIKNHVGFTSY